MRNYRRAQVTNSSLSEADVRSIRLRYAAGQATVRQLAEEFKLAAESVRKILRRETWAMVSEEGPGAPPEAWAAAFPQPTAADVAASFARLQSLVPEHVPAGLAPSLEEALRLQAEREAGAEAPGLTRLNEEAAKLRRGDQVLDELTGHGNVAEIGAPIPPAIAGTSDGGKP